MSCSLCTLCPLSQKTLIWFLSSVQKKQNFIFGCFLLDFWDHGNKAITRRTTNFLNYFCENVAVTKRIQQPLDAYFAREKK